MKFRASGVTIWFLDADLRKSAEYLTDFALDKSIGGCVQALVCARLWAGGVRSKKAYAYRFSRERSAETRDRLFPGWPFRSDPSFKSFTLKTSRWARQCAEHCSYVGEYLTALLDEYEFRGGRAHKMAAFADWWFSTSSSLRLPSAGIREIHLPWKALKKKFWRKDILAGYRLQYIDTFCWGDPLAAYAKCARDVPSFVSEFYALDSAAMVT